MDIEELISMQRDFDAERETNFPWSAPITEEDPSALSHNVLALCGEVGEIANVVKKFERGDFDFSQLRSQVSGEIADVFIYLLKISYQFGIDLEFEFKNKLQENETRFPRLVPKEFPPTATAFSEAGLDFDQFDYWSDSELLFIVDRLVGQCTEFIGPTQMRRLDSVYASAGVHDLLDTESKVSGVVVALIFAEVAGPLDGRPGKRDSVWHRLASIAHGSSLSRSNIVALSTYRPMIIGLLADILNHSEASGDQV